MSGIFIIAIIATVKFIQWWKKIDLCWWEKSCTDTISAKMRQLEYKDNIDYNKKAVNAYNSAFTSFKNNESRYKDKSQLLGLVSTTLFAYDAGRLFNETLIFYNHVYSYIFNKLDDNGKLELTKYSIECERKQG